jgi:hypothetical protein
MSARLFSVNILARMVSGAALLASSALLAQAAPQAITFGHRAAPQSITLDHGGAPQSPNYLPAKGEFSFANGPASFYAFSPAHVGEPAPLEAVTLRFSEPDTITKIETMNKDFVVEDGGSCAAGNSYSKGDSCIVLMRFTPQGPGRRLGKLTISHTASAEPDAFGLGGTGYAPAISFVPALAAPIGATLSGSTGVLKSAGNLAIDGGDVLYIADTGNTKIRQIDSSGTLSTTGAVAAPASIAVDTFGDIFAISPSSSVYFSIYYPYSSIEEISGSYTSGKTCTESSPCTLGSVGLDAPGSLSIDANNDIFLAEETKGAMEMPVADVSSGVSFPALDVWYLSDSYSYDDGSPTAVAVNVDDELFTDYTYTFTTPNICDIVEESAYAAASGTASYYRVAGASKCGYSGDGGQAGDAEIGTSIGQIAFDAAGNLYFTDSANQRVRRINVDTGIITTVVGDGVKGFVSFPARSTAATLNNPTGLAVDSQGQIYVITEAPSGSSTEVVEKVSATGYLVFPNQTEGATSAAQIVTVTNTGNSDAVLTSYAFTGTNPGDFSIDPTTTSCLLTAGSTLYAGGTCQIGVLFKPAATGTRTANLVFLDNTVTNSNTVEVVGSSTAPSPSFVPGAVSFPATTPSETTTIPVTLTNTGNVDLEVSNIALSGANASAFSFTGDCAGGSIKPGSSCSLSVSFKPSSTGSYSAALNVSDNAPNSPQSVAVSGSGAKPYTSATRLASGTNPSGACAAVTFHITVSTSDGSVASGPVSLRAGTLPIASGTLTNGAAALTVQGLAPGLNLLTASYGGDAEHAGSTSAILSQVVERGSCGNLGLPQPGHEGPLQEPALQERP